MIDLNWLTVVIAVVLPMLTALVTKRVATGGVKAATLAVLSAVGGVVSELYSVGGEFAAMNWNGTLSDALTVFLVGVGFHYGLLKPLGATGTDGAIATAVPGGVGADRGDVVTQGQ